MRRSAYWLGASVVLVAAGVSVAGLVSSSAMMAAAGGWLPRATRHVQGRVAPQAATQPGRQTR